MPSLFLRDLLDREYFGMKLGLEKMRTLLARLDHPEKKFHSIHVAGTNGKGSTAVMIARILEAGKYKVGVFTSPHLQHVNERFQINGYPITTSRLASIAKEVQKHDFSKERISFFEFMTAVAFLYFAEEKVDVAVVEVGMGGRLDATNVLKPEVSVITSVAYDHEKHLGRKLEHIAAEKGGIIKEDVPLVCGESSPPIRKVLAKMAKNTSIEFVDAPQMHHDGTFSSGSFQKLWIPTLGPGHALNASVAVAAVQAFAKRCCGRSVLPRSAFYRGLASSVIPGRMEIVRRRPFVILDGAHNPAAVENLVATCRQTFRNRRIHCLFGAMADKDIAAMIKQLHALGGDLHVAAPQMKRAATSSDLNLCAQRYDWRAQEHTDCQSALKQILKSLDPSEALVVTGSLFLVGEARAYLRRTDVPTGQLVAA
jgi:dihydrofolate synthase/folylpolyglutamate synthase